MLSIKETIVEVLVARNTNAGEVAVVNPDFGGRVNVNQVFALGCAVELEVANDDVGDLADLETTVGEASVAANTEDRGIADSNLYNAAASQGALDLDHTTHLGGSRELSARSDSSASTAATSCCASGETNQFINLGGALLHRSSNCGRRHSQSRGSHLEELHRNRLMVFLIENVTERTKNIQKMQRMNRDRLWWFE